MEKINLVKASQLTSPNPLALVCTTKEDGNTNIATISWYTYLSFKSNLIGLAMSKHSYTGEMIRKNKKLVLTIPGSQLDEVVKKCGSISGRTTDKVKEYNIELQELESCDIKIPQHIKVAMILNLNNYIEVGDHYFYICKVEEVYSDESEEALYAWNGYSLIKPSLK